MPDPTHSRGPVPVLNGHNPYPLDDFGLPMHPAFAKSRMLPARRRVLVWLAAEGGEVVVQPGVNTTGNRPAINPAWMRERSGFEPEGTTMSTLMAHMARDGLIIRAINGKQTKGLALSPEWAEKLADLMPSALPAEPTEPDPAPPIEPTPRPVPEPEPATDIVWADTAPVTWGSNGVAAGPPKQPRAEAVPLFNEGTASVASGLGDDDLRALAVALLDQAVDAIVTAREVAGPDSSLVEHMQLKLADALDDNARLRTRLGESRDHNHALAQMLDKERRDRRAAQDQITALTRQIRKLPAPADEQTRRELDRLMREIPRTSRRLADG